MLRHFEPTNSVAIILIEKLLLHRAISNIFLQFNVLTLRQANNILIHWCWLLILLLVGYCLLDITLPYSTTVYQSTNQCSKDEWNNTGDRCCNGNTGGTWVTRYISVTCWREKETMIMSLVNNHQSLNALSFIQLCKGSVPRDILQASAHLESTNQ